MGVLKENEEGGSEVVKGLIEAEVAEATHPHYTTCKNHVGWPHGLILVALPQHAAQSHGQARVHGEGVGGPAVDGEDR